MMWESDVEIDDARRHDAARLRVVDVDGKQQWRPGEGEGELEG
jgi:hypothetical protein